MQKDREHLDDLNPSRRDFIKKAGAVGAGLLVVPYLKPSGVFAYNLKRTDSFLATVSLTNTTSTPADSYTYDDSNGGQRFRPFAA